MDTPVTAIVAALTVTKHVAFFPPSDVVQVMVAEPADLAVTVPSEATVAIEVLLEDQDTLVLVALLGDTVAPSLYVCPAVKDKDVGETETPVTETVEEVTVTLHVAVLLPSAVLTVIVADPTFFPVTTPPEDTVAIVVLLEDHVIDLFVASEGFTLADNDDEPPTTKLKEDLFKLTLVTGTFFFSTVTEHVAVLLPSTVFTVIVAVPTFLAVTSPSEDTVTTEVLLDDHVTLLLVALDGLTLAVNSDVSPSFSVIEVLDRETPVTFITFALTVTEHVAVLP